VFERMNQGNRSGLVVVVVALAAFTGCSDRASQGPDAAAQPAPDATALPGPDTTALPDQGVDAPGQPVGVDPKLLSYADKAARWLEAEALSQDSAARWPEYVGMPAWTGQIAHPVSLYSGVAGIALYAKKLAHVTGDPRHDKLARAAGQQLVKAAIKSGDGYYWENEVELKSGEIIKYKMHGLYNGAAGVGYTLLMLGQKPANKQYVDLARGAGNWILSSANKGAAGCSWTYGFTDIIGGNAGIILFLLELHKATGEAKYLAGAECAGDWLLGQAVADGQGSYWHSQSIGTRIYPGFSHGVSGIAYALAALYEAGGKSKTKYMDAAKAGAAWLKAEALCDADGCRWYHYRPDSVGVYSMGTSWCHGMAGHGRFFLQMWRLTQQPEYKKLAEDGARWVMKVADPALPAPRFHGLSFCCGAAAVGEFFVDLHLRTQKKEYLTYAHKVATYLASKGHAAQGGMAWTNYNVPDKDGRIWYAPGLKIGAAGAGWFLLRLALVGSTAQDWPVIPDERM
jgi:lantibiotic modifying enzyme